MVRVTWVQVPPSPNVSAHENADERTSHAPLGMATRSIPAVGVNVDDTIVVVAVDAESIVAVPRAVGFAIATSGHGTKSMEKIPPAAKVMRNVPPVAVMSAPKVWAMMPLFPASASA